LETQHINIPLSQIITRRGNKADNLKKHNICLFFDDSKNVVRDIHRSYQKCKQKCKFILYHYNKGLYNFDGKHFKPLIQYHLWHCSALSTESPLFRVSNADENVHGILYQDNSSVPQTQAGILCEQPFRCRLMKQLPAEKWIPQQITPFRIMSWNMQWNGDTGKMKHGMEQNSEHNDIIATQELNPYTYTVDSDGRVTTRIRDAFECLNWEWDCVYFGTGNVKVHDSRKIPSQRDTATVWWRRSEWKCDDKYPIREQPNGKYPNGAGRNNIFDTTDSRGCVGVRLVQNIGDYSKLEYNVRPREIIVVSIHAPHKHKHDSRAQTCTINTIEKILHELNAATVDDIIIMGDFNELNPKKHILPYINALYKQPQPDGYEQGKNELYTIPEVQKYADYILHIIPSNSKSVCKPFDVNIGYTEKTQLWEWQDGESWKLYPTCVQKQLNKASQTNTDDLQIFDGEYTVSLTHMTQTNNDTQFSRDIRIQNEVSTQTHGSDHSQVYTRNLELSNPITPD